MVNFNFGSLYPFWFNIKFFCLIAALICLSSCLGTKSNQDSTAGANLGFEYWKDGLPSNWIFYDPPGFEYRILPDSTGFKEGKRSLHLQIRKSSDHEKLNYAGFTGEFPELSRTSGKYRISFYVRNQGTRFRIFSEAVRETDSSGQPVLMEVNQPILEWKQYELHVNVPSGMWLRFEIQVKGEGDFFIDGITISKI